MKNKIEYISFITDCTGDRREGINMDGNHKGFVLKMYRAHLNKVVLLLIVVVMFICANAQTKELHIGTAIADITPTLPVALDGQFELRIATTVETPLTANVVALESRDGDRTLEVAIMVSCDVIIIPDKLLKMVRDEVHHQMPDLDITKIVLNAIHTHTAPVLDPDASGYQIPKNGVLQIDEYETFFANRVSEAIVKAWKNRQPGSVSWGLSHAAIANNRRAVYSKVIGEPGALGNGTSQMYGQTNMPEFLGIEGMDEHDVNSLFFWNKAGKLIAITIDIPCPAQEVEHLSAVNADYWHPVREKLKARFGSELCVLGWIGAAGDQSPHLMYRKAAENRMMELRKLNRLDELARRIDLAVEEAYETVKDDRHSNVQLIHKAETLALPLRLVTKEEYLSSKGNYEKYSAIIAADPSKMKDVNGFLGWFKNVISRYETQQKNPDPTMQTEIHVIRLGDIAICTNQFELFTDYGIEIQARSNALQTFVVQLAGFGTYLPTEKAVKGGGYSAIIQSNLVGPEGGKFLVDRTIELINRMWPEKE